MLKPDPAAPKALERRKFAAAVFCACVSLWLYAVFVHLCGKMTSAEPTGMSEVFYWVRPVTHATLGTHLPGSRGFGYIGKFLACCGGLFAMYGIMVRLARGAGAKWLMAVAFVSAAVFMGVLLCSPVMLSSDTYAYSYYGRLLATYGLDAHVAAPDYTFGDPFLLNGWFQFVPSVYGPLWTVISAGFVMAGRGHVGLTLLMFRAFEAGCAMGTAGLVWLVLRRLSPARAAQGAVLFLWNPLVIIESALGGHNDCCMMLLALAALWLHLRGFKVAAVAALVLSALVKVITAPLVPLYILMILRTQPSWKERGWFLGRSGAATAAAVALAMLAARMNPTAVWTHTASSADFYENNYHEMVFKGLRHLFGEPADSLNAPMDFESWWVTTKKRVALHTEVSKKSPKLAHVNLGRNLLVLSDEDSDEWLRVYDPASHQQGYVDSGSIKVIPEPPDAQADPVAARLSGAPAEWPTVVKANHWIRLGTWILFVAFGLMAAWKAADFEQFIAWGAGFFLVAQLLVFSRIWPWYLVWPLAFGAVKPEGPATRLALLLSVGMLTMYPLLDLCMTRWDWLYACRSVPCIVLPVVIFAAMAAWRSFNKAPVQMTPSAGQKKASATGVVAEA